MSLLRIALFASIVFALPACRLVYTVDVNQGNLVEQDMVDSLKPGMTKRQVALVMGSPSVQTPFDQDRWDYVASISRRGRKAEIKNLTLFFDGNLLVRIEGDYFPQRDVELLEDSKRIRGRAEDDITDETRPRRKPGGGRPSSG
jgi:outer membrane protein assembly factor BamE